MKGVRLNVVCTTEKGARYIYTDEMKAVYDEMDGWEQSIWLGIQLMPEGYSSDEVVISENELFLCGNKVMDYESYVQKFDSLSNQIPRQYVIRTYDEQMGYHSFECGFDLLDDGRAWESIKRTKYDTIADALQFVRERVGDDFTIWLEEPMQI